MGEDPLNDGGVVDRSDELRSAGAARTAQDVQVERSAHQRPPALRSAGGPADRSC